MNKFEFEDLLLVLSEKDENGHQVGPEHLRREGAPRRRPECVRHPRPQKPGVDHPLQWMQWSRGWERESWQNFMTC